MVHFSLKVREASWQDITSIENYYLVLSSNSSIKFQIRNYNCDIKVIFGNIMKPHE